jgi:NADPH:quinone reductase-like Zn-dependent oxidoreductase
LVGGSAEDDQHPLRIVLEIRSQETIPITKDVDVVLDGAGEETLERSWQVLARGGVLVSIVEPPSQAQAARYGVRAAEYCIVRPDRDPPHFVSLRRVPHRLGRVVR